MYCYYLYVIDECSYSEIVFIRIRSLTGKAIAAKGAGSCL